MTDTKKEGGGLASKYRKLVGKWRLVTIGFPLVALVIGVIGVFGLRPFGWVMLDSQFLFLLLAFFLPLAYIWIPATKKTDRFKVAWYDIVLAVLGFVVPMYFAINAYSIARGWSIPGVAPVAAVIGCFILWFIMFEAARRAVSWVFALILIILSFYPLYGVLLPGLFQSQPFSIVRIALFHVFSEDSIKGIPLQVFGRLFFGYMMFAIALQICGIGEFFNKIAASLLGRTRGGNAKVAIFASGLFGSISGHPGANIFATGVFTIPAMKRDGFKSEVAASVEACASTGGSLLPPIMGATAFIMADFLEVPYADICIVAVVPAILYYLCLFMQIDAYSAAHHLRVGEVTLADAHEPILKIIWQYIHLVFGFAVLLFVLFYMRLESLAPWYGVAATFVAAMLRKSTRLYLKDFVRFLEDTGRTLGQMMGIMAPVGMVIGSLVLTGVAYSLPYTIVSLAGDNMAVLLFFGALASFVLGMGVSPSACYIFLAIILCPGLVMAGVNLMAAHMFVLYCSLWSNLTPPVALSSFTAAIIADSNPMRTAVTSMRIGFGTFLIPFLFVANPGLLLLGDLTNILTTVISAVIGLALMCGSFESYMWGLGRIASWQRIAFFIAGICMAIPGYFTDIIGIVVGVATFAVSYFVFKPKTAMAGAVSDR